MKKQEIAEQIIQRINRMHNDAWDKAMELGLDKSPTGRARQYALALCGDPYFRILYQLGALKKTELEFLARFIEPDTG